MKINNRIIQYSAGVFFMLICTRVGLNFAPANNNEDQPA